jgi:hypothetical protein
VIDLGDQSFLVDIGGSDRANLGAGRIIAVHTGPGKKPSLDVRIFSFNIGDQFDPVNRAASFRLLGSDKSNVILGLTGNDTGLTSRASVQIDHHSPAMHSSLLQKNSVAPHDPIWFVTPYIV